MLYNFVVLVKEDDIPIVRKTVKYIKKHLSPKKILIIGNSNVKSKIQNIYDEIIFMHEDAIYPGLNFSNIKSIIEQAGGDTLRSGWYFQQFLKFAYSSICEDECYIVWDSDTIPLRKIEFLNKDNKYLFTMRRSVYIWSEFYTLSVIFDGKVAKKCDDSFISEHMIIDKKIMLELIHDIETNENIKGKLFYEKILNSIEKDSWMLGFSEFETYGNYVMKYYPEKYGTRELKTYRNAKQYFGIPSKKQIEWASNSFDIISIEKWDEVGWIKKCLSNNNWIRSHVSFERLIYFFKIIEKFSYYIKKIYSDLQ